MFTEKEIKGAIDKAYKDVGHNAYFGNGFEAGIKFAIESNRLEKLSYASPASSGVQNGGSEQEIFVVYDPSDGEILCAFVDEDYANVDAEKSGCGVKKLRLVLGNKEH